MSKVKWYPVNSGLRGDFVNKIQVKNLELYDSRPLGELYSEEKETFRIVNHGQRPYEFLDDVHLTVTFELSLDRIKIQRFVFSLLDWLGDVGGLIEILFISFSLVYALFHYQTFE